MGYQINLFKTKVSQYSNYVSCKLYVFYEFYRIKPISKQEKLIIISFTTILFSIFGLRLFKPDIFFFITEQLYSSNVKKFHHFYSANS